MSETKLEYNNLSELLLCSKLDLPNYQIIKYMGEGAIKKAFLAKAVLGNDIWDENNDNYTVLLMIDPNSKGISHYKNIYGEFNMKKVLKEEFSASKIRNLEDKRYISEIWDPIVGKYENNPAYFIPCTPYETTLDRLISTINTDTALKYFRQIMTGLYNCHKEGIIHKDLKPDNIGISKKGNIVLSDFGSLSLFSETANSRYQYPLHLRPPELAHDEDYFTKNKSNVWQGELFTPEANVWTTGVILYEMLTHERLFTLKPGEKRATPFLENTKTVNPLYHEQNKYIYDQIHSFAKGDLVLDKKDKKFTFEDIIREKLNDDYSLYSLVLECLKPDPKDRINVFVKLKSRLQLGYN